jgi:four helix bundle protein
MSRLLVYRWKADILAEDFRIQSSDFRNRPRGGHAGTRLGQIGLVASGKADDLKARTKQFALDVLSFRRGLPVTVEAADLGWQLSRAATGVAANYRAACRSRSDAEFAARIGVVLEEADESAFWLEILTADGLCRGQRATTLLDEANQLTAIFAASCITARRRLQD